MNVRASFFFLPLLFLACGGSTYDQGYDDGYAAGYNTTCDIRATLIEGDWDDEDYSKGYRAGYEDGAQDCRESRNE